MKRVTMLFTVVALLVLGGISPVLAESGFYTTNCAGCHGTSSSTCAGCHAHGVHSSSAKSDLRLTGTTNKTNYTPGETVNVTINGGYRSGWVRAILYDQNMNELARNKGSFPITLSAKAPTAGGRYTWNVAWYGNKNDKSGAFFGSGWTPDPNNTNHGLEVVATNAFDVAATAAPDINLSPASLDFGAVAINGAVTRGVQVQNLGTAALTVTAIAPCTGTSAEYARSPASPFTVAAGGTQTLSVTYWPVDEGADTGCLSIGSNDTATPTVQLALAGSGYTPQPAVLDLDIGRFNASKRVSRSRGGTVNFKLQVNNAGTVEGNVTATLTGVQNGVAVYSESITVYDSLATGSTSFSFPSFVPTALGAIAWTVTVADEDPDLDTAAVTTTVVR